MKRSTGLIILVMTVVGLLAACLGGVGYSMSHGHHHAEQTQASSSHNSGLTTKRPPNPPGVKPATCNELPPAKDLKFPLLEGNWVLREKLEFPDGSQHHTVVPNRDQTAICMRTVISDVSEREATLHTSFWSNSKLTKNYTGFIKVKEAAHWDMHFLAKDHDGLVVLSEPKSHVVFVECVNDSKGSTMAIPGSVLVLTRGSSSEEQLANLRKQVEGMLRHADETFMDFGAYCI